MNISPAKAQRRKESQGLEKNFAPLRLCGRLLLCFIMFPIVAFAHEGKPHNWHDLARAWSFEPVVVISLAISAILFVVGLRHLWRESPKRRSIRTWEALCFGGGWLALFIALVSPMHAWGQVLFSAHMTQHEVLMLVAAPLLVLGRPLIAFLRALPSTWARALARLSNRSWWQSIWLTLSSAFVAWVVHAIVLWVWHLPAL